MIARRRALAGMIAAAGVAVPPGSRKPEALTAESYVCDFDEYRLIDVVGPDGRGPPRRARALLAWAKRELQALLESGAPEIRSASGSDRWGRGLVRPLHGGATRTFQESLVEAGALRVNPESEDEDAIAVLLALEASARAARRGLWSEPAYAPFAADRADASVGAFNLVEGVVASARAARGRVYLNFGADYRDDFTATAPTRLARAWAKRDLDLLRLEGVEVRARGYVARINGPSIELRRPQALELLATRAASAVLK